MQFPGKVKNQTPKVDKKEKKSGKRKKKIKSKHHVVEKEKIKNIEKKVNRWEDKKHSEGKKKSRMKTDRREKRKMNKFGDNSFRNQENVRREYNDFFSYFNLPSASNYTNLLQFLEKTEVEVLIDDEKRENILMKTNWRRNNNLKLLANISCFPETHHHLESKYEFSKNITLEFLDFLETEKEEEDREKASNESLDTLIDYLRIIGNLSFEETYFDPFVEHKLFEIMLDFPKKYTKGKNNKCLRIVSEIARFLSNLILDERILEMLKKKANVLEDLTYFTVENEKNEYASKFLTILWTTLDQAHETFIDQFVKNEEHQEFIEEKVLTVCSVFEEHPENMIRVDVPEVLLVANEGMNEDEFLSFPVTRRKTGLFARISRGGGGKVHKPVIYFYPKQDEQRVRVDLDFKGDFTITIPDVRHWSDLEIKKNGKIKDKSTMKWYNYLFWEGNVDQDFLKKQGYDHQFVVQKENIPQFLRGYCRKYMNQRETNEFLDYWVPVFEGIQSKFFQLSFLIDEKWNEVADLKISPQPDLVIRLFMIFNVIEERNISQVNHLSCLTDINPLNENERNHKFTVVEWGGMMKD